MIKFYFPECPYCQRLSPYYDQLAKEYEGKVQFCEINTHDGEKELSLFKKLGCKSVPTLVFIDKSGTFKLVRPMSRWGKDKDALMDGMRTETEKMLRSYK